MVQGMVLTIFVELVKKVIVTRLVDLGSVRILLGLFLHTGMRQSRCLSRDIGWARSSLADFAWQCYFQIVQMSAVHSFSYMT
jgi:hypothetical protein